MRVETRPTTTPFFRLNADMGWSLGPEHGASAIPYDDRPLALARRGREPIALAEPNGSFGGRTLVRGLALSSEGRMFLAAPARREILTALIPDAGAAPPRDADSIWPFRPLWPARTAGDPYALVEPVDVALAPSGDLVIADRGAGRLLVITWPGAEIRQDIALGAGARPSSIAFDAAGRCHIADPGLATIHRFSPVWRKDDSYPHSSVVLTAPCHVAAIAPISAGGEDLACACEGACGCASQIRGAPILAALDKTKLVCLDAWGGLADIPDPLTLTPPALTLDAGVLSWRDPAFPGRDPLTIASLDPDRRGRHRGSGLALLARPRRVQRPSFGEAVLGPFDSGAAGFSWDRITLDAMIPPSGRIVLTTLTLEQEMERDRLDSLPDTRWSRPLAINPGDRPEVLIQSRPGRYLYIRIELSGDGSESPSIAEIDLFGPRRSSLQYLPAPFHDDPESASFLDRFLSYFDVVFDEIRRQNTDIARNFDPDAAPEGAMLDWLGAWFDLDFPASWPVATRRVAVAEATALHRSRGTAQGLRRVLQWQTGLSDPLPQIIEHFRLPANGDPVFVGGEDLNAGRREHRMTILLPAEHLAAEDDRRVINRLIAGQLPAHVSYQLLPIETALTIGRQSTLGVDTLIGARAPEGLGDARLGETFGPAPLPAGPAGIALTSTDQGGLSC